MTDAPIVTRMTSKRSRVRTGIGIAATAMRFSLGQPILDGFPAHELYSRIKERTGLKHRIKKYYLDRWGWNVRYGLDLQRDVSPLIRADFRHSTGKGFRRGVVTTSNIPTPHL